FPGLGRGWIATRPISKGEEILTEYPYIITPSQLTDKEIKSKVSRWPTDQESWFWSLEIADSFEEQGPYLGRFRTNSIPINLSSDPIPHYGLSRYGTYFNHSCRPNVIQQLSSSKRMVFRALRDIHPEELLCIPYDLSILLCPQATRLKELRLISGFECICPDCTNPDEASDANRTELGRIMRDSFLTRTYEEGKENVRLQLLEEEGLYPYREYLYYSGFRVCQALGGMNGGRLQPEAEKWLQLAYDAYLSMQGSDSPFLRGLHHILVTKQVPPSGQVPTRAMTPKKRILEQPVQS
ncbi:SET domain-containing protein, partial [Serendipita vermifera]